MPGGPLPAAASCWLSLWWVQPLVVGRCSHPRASAALTEEVGHAHFKLAHLWQLLQQLPGDDVAAALVLGQCHRLLQPGVQGQRMGGCEKVSHMHNRPQC